MPKYIKEIQERKKRTMKNIKFSWGELIKFRYANSNSFRIIFCYPSVHMGQCRYVVWIWRTGFLYLHLLNKYNMCSQVDVVSQLWSRTLTRYRKTQKPTPQSNSISSFRPTPNTCHQFWANQNSFKYHLRQ